MLESSPADEQRPPVVQLGVAYCRREMMRIARMVLVLALATLIAWPLFAAEPKKKERKKKPPPCPAAKQVDGMVRTLTLTDEQKTKLDEIKKEFGPKLMAAMKKMDVLTPEQKKAKAEAAKKAKEAGKKGKEAREAVDAAVNITDQQKADMAEAKKEMGAIGKELKEKVMAVLTDEQKQRLKKPKADKKPRADKKPKKPAK